MLTGVDPLGRRIVLTASMWETHVLAQRPWMAPYLPGVKEAIRSPAWINHDVDYEDRECFYAENVLPNLPHLLLKLVIHFVDESHGVVITVYPLKRPKSSEVRKWPTP